MLINFVISLVLCSGILFGFAHTSQDFAHWFVVPVFLCGVMMGADVVNWLRGRTDNFDPAGLIGCAGFHFFFLAPLLHVSFDYWILRPDVPEDWRPWLGYMAILSFLGLLVYRGTRCWFARKRVGVARGRTVWRLKPETFSFVLPIFLLLSALMQIAIYVRFGGIGAFIEAYEAREHIRLAVGRMDMIAGNFPALLMIGFAIYAKRRRIVPSWPVVFLMLFLALASKTFFGGLRGSRADVVWSAIAVVGIAHFGIRPLPKKLIVLGALLLMAFAHVYSIYKGGGREAFQAYLTSPEERSRIEERTWRSLPRTLLGDFGRSDIQALILYRMSKPESDFRYALGRTYLGGALSFVPTSVWPHLPATKVKEGTQVQFGRYSWSPGRHVTNVYGLAGEAMLNFGPLAVPFAFAVLGLAVGLIRRAMATWDASDTRLFLLPYFLSMCFLILIMDSNNMQTFLQKSLVYPLILIVLISARYRSPVRIPAFFRRSRSQRMRKVQTA